MSTSPPEPDDSALYQPSVDAAPSTTGRPWRPASQAYVAFFGGVVAVTAIAFLNARRLRVRPDPGPRILLLGAVALVAVAAVTAAWWEPGQPQTLVRLAGRVIAVVLHLPLLRLLDPAARAFELRDGTYASLWGPGILAAIVGGIVQALFVVLVERLVG